jgi:Mg2+/Co2+ transporter CorB
MVLTDITPEFLEWLSNKIGHAVSYETALEWSFIIILSGILLIPLKWIVKYILKVIVFFIDGRPQSGGSNIVKMN